MAASHDNPLFPKVPMGDRIMQTDGPYTSAEFDAATAQAASDGAVSAKEHLELAMRYAMRDLFFIDNDQGFNRAREAIVRSALPLGLRKLVNDSDMDEGRGPAAIRTLTDRTRNISGKEEVNPIWLNSGFVMPAIAALALLLERSLHPTGDSRITLYLHPDADALYGYHLIDVKVHGFGINVVGQGVSVPPTQADLREIVAHLTGASYFFCRGEDMVEVGSRYLRYIASQSPGWNRPTGPATDAIYAVLV